MGVKVYVLLDIVDEKSKQVAQALRGKPGVVMADPLEGPPDVVMAVESSERLMLAELIVQAVTSVETMIKGVHLLPAQVEINTYASPNPLGAKKQ